MFIATSETPQALIKPRKRSTQIPKYQFSTSGALTIITPRKDIGQSKKNPIMTLPTTSRTPAYKSPILAEKISTNSSRVYKESLFSEYAFNPRKMSQNFQQPDNSGKQPLSVNPNIIDLQGLKYIMSNSSDLVSGQVPKDMKIKFQPFLMPYKQPKEFAQANIDPMQETPKQTKKKVQIVKRLEGYESLQSQLPLNKEPVTTNNRADFRISHYMKVKSYTTEHSPQPSHSSRSTSPFGKGSIASTRLTTERNGMTRRSQPQEVESTTEIKTPRQVSDVSCIRMLDLCNTDILDEMQKKTKNTDTSALDTSDSARMRTQFDIQKLKEKIRFTPIFDCKLVSIVNKNHLNIMHRPGPNLESNLLNKNKFMTPQIKAENSYSNELSQAYSLPPMQTPIKQNERVQLSKLVRFEVKS